MPASIMCCMLKTEPGTFSLFERGKNCCPETTVAYITQDSSKCNSFMEGEGGGCPLINYTNNHAFKYRVLCLKLARKLCVV